MDAFETVRLAASDLHTKAVEKGADPWVPLSLLSAAAEEADVEVSWVRPGDPALMGGRALLDPQMMMVICENTGTEAERAILAAHEIGHAVLHKPSEPIIDHTVDPSRLTERAASGVEKVVDYGRRERRELQADLFAREFLLPRERARRLHLDEGFGADEIASRSGLPYAVVAQQLLDALLLPMTEPESDEHTDRPDPGLDPSQEAAATHLGRPYQLQAGPGTGKTRTLIARVERLIDQGVDPATILVLTFSNKAAGELIDRLSRSRPDAAPGVWIGTFHAFGLDILHRFHDRLGLPSNPWLIDRADAVGLVEDLVPVLPFRHFRNFFDPTADLGDMLSAISRAKDEVCDPTTYRALAEAMAAQADADGDESAAARAVKVMDVAILYEAYEQQLRTAGLLDFGDLVMRPVQLVEQEVGVREALRERHHHVLVDEYQDVNRASVRLLKAIVGDGERLWVVGDARQSIYRFRGASSANMAGFTRDFPAGVIGQLDVNYRSTQEVVETFVGFARQMKASSGMLDLRLTATRGPSGHRHQVRRVEQPVDEGAAVAARILELKEQGVAFRDQAVLCRGNGRLADIAEALEERDIPVLYLGSLFERSDIKDMLSLLALLVDPKAGGLPRIAAMPRTSIAMADLAALQAHCARFEAPLEWLTSAAATVSPQAATALATVAADITGFGPDSHPWSVLAAWLLDRSGLVRRLASSSRPRDQIRAIAIWQFMAFCRSLPTGNAGRPIQRLLDRARRLALLSEERDLRQMPAAASGLDAVRLMTVHGSKGLEFDAVHMPGLTMASFPTNNMPPRCTPPDGMIAGAEGLTGLDAVRRGHDEEEECLFFVGVSRARRHLTLYGATRQANGNRRNPSPFLGEITASLDVIEPATLFAPSARGHAKPDIRITWATPPILTQDHLSQYDRCPRRYLLTHVLGVPGGRSATPFVRMHDVVNAMIRWLRGHPSRWHLTSPGILAQFDLMWQERGPVEHASADDYRRVALRLVEHLLTTRRTEYAEPTPVEIPLPGARIIVTPDEVRSDGAGGVFRRIRTGKERSTEMDDVAYGLLLLAARERFGPAAAVEAIYLTDETMKPAEIGERKLANQRDKVAKMAADIAAGYFPPKPDARTCPRCPHFFTCGTLPTGELVKQ
jgi:DNA helicase II / ATP-dependent DNA helicase PcrA